MASWSFITYYCVITMLLIAYVLGSIPSAVWIGKKYYGVDIREHGSKNAGTTNMLRVLGRRAALPVFVLDFFKGFVAVTLIGLMRYDADINSAWLINLKILGVFAAVIGHIFPIFANFKGGKGVATLVGAVTGIYPQIIFLCFAVWCLVFLISHYVSLASMTAGCCFPLLVVIYSSSEWSRNNDVSFTFIIFAFAVAILLLWSHRKNIERLKAGTESKIYIWKSSDNKEAKKE
ncbi:MAG: glycerol-3-phosphate 1-O-acyltransferase PlsY [Alistipes sp.]|nr:glycerol-3-phosphate 1-O-acyltransferase PlsY [Alistipes sp.]